MTSSLVKVSMLRWLGVEPVVADAFDVEAVTRAAVQGRPDLVMN